MFTTPEKAIFGLYGKLYDDKLTPTRCDKRKLRTIKRVLMRADLIFPIFLDPASESLWSADRHIGNKFGLGPNHPQHQQFRLLYEPFQQAQMGLLNEIQPLLDEDDPERSARIEPAMAEDEDDLPLAECA